MSLYDVISDIDRMRSERAAVRTLGARMDADVRNPNVGWTVQEVVPNSAIDQRQQVGEGTSTEDITAEIEKAIADGGAIANWAITEGFTTLAKVAADGFQKATQVATAISNAASDVGAVGVYVLSKSYLSLIHI